MATSHEAIEDMRRQATEIASRDEIILIKRTEVQRLLDDINRYKEENAALRRENGSYARVIETQHALLNRSTGTTDKFLDKMIGPKEEKSDDLGAGIAEDGSARNPFHKPPPREASTSPEVFRTPVNPHMDEHAKCCGLSHWRCVSPSTNSAWMRSDGLFVDDFVSCGMGYFPHSANQSYIDVLKEADRRHPLKSRCQEMHPTGQQCLLEAGHKGNHEVHHH